MCGQIRSIFIVLSDDLYRPRGDRSATRGGPRASAPPAPTAAAADPPEGASSESESTDNSMDASEVATGSNSVPIPTPAIPPNPASVRRTQKRGASAELSGSAKK